MILGNHELTSLYRGAYRFDENRDGYLAAYQYTEEQMAYFKRVSDFWFDRCAASTAKTLEFVTDASRFSFEYKMTWVGAEDSFELLIDGLVTRIDYVRDLKREGTLSYSLPAGKKSVILYLPSDATVLIRRFETDGRPEPVRKNEKMLWLGDSITQGYGPLRSSCTYVSVANRLLNYDIINQGIGGYVYDKNSLMKMPGYAPDKIIVALGTNQFMTESMEDVETFYARLIELYGTDIPVLCVTPLWRGDIENGEPVMIRFCERLRAICGRYPNIRILDGFKMVPHLPEYYRDNLHPNELGAQLYGSALADGIRRIGF